MCFCRNAASSRSLSFFPRSSPLADFSATAVFQHICCQCIAKAQPPHPLRVFPGMRRRWRWTFQNKRRRYSREGRRDTGQRRPLPDIGAVRDTGRSPLHLLPDDRASRDGACGSNRRRRARGLARRPRTLRRQEDQGRPGKEGRHRVQQTHRQHHARTRTSRRRRSSRTGTTAPRSSS